MDIVIVSFNVLNLNTKENDLNSTFKEKKCQKIAELLSKEDFSIIALQEIQSEDAVSRIVRYMNGNTGNTPYDFCHCASIYDELNDHGIRNRHGSKFKSDYGFIWDTRKVFLYCDKALYKGLEDCEKKEWNHLLEQIVDILLKAYQNALSQGGQFSNLFSKLPRGESLEIHREKLLATLHQTLRPPLIACFKPVSFFGSLLHEIRIINTHAQWKANSIYETGTSREIRQLEMRFIQGTLHSAVNTLRTGSFNTVYTIVAGDFNLNLDEIKPIYADTKYFENHQMETIQSYQSTCKWDSENEEIRPVSNYDHFAFDRNRITQYMVNEAIVQPVSITKESFLLDKKLLSDHMPIKMTLSF